MGSIAAWSPSGRYPIVSLAQARDKAKRLLAERVLGLDRLVPTPTFADAFELFKQTYNPPRERTKRETVRIIAKHLLPRFGPRRIGEITTPEIAAIIDKLLSTPGAANHVYAAARLIFRWAWRRRMVESARRAAAPPPDTCHASVFCPTTSFAPCFALLVTARPLAP